MSEPANPVGRLVGSVLIAAVGLVCVCLARGTFAEEGAIEGRYGLMSIGVLLVLVGPWIPLEWRIHLDFERGELVHTTYYGPGVLGRRTMPLSEFDRVVVRPSARGLEGGDPHGTTEVGLVLRDGRRVLRLKSFVCEGGVPAPEALALARRIHAATGLPGEDFEDP